MVYRVYVEKKKEYAKEAEDLKKEIQTLLQITALEDIRILYRYDVQGITKELFDFSVQTVFSEPQLDVVTEEAASADVFFIVSYLPGQFDQRADSAAQCIQMISQKERPVVKTAKVYLLYGALRSDEIEKIKKYVINPVESQEVPAKRYETLETAFETPREVETLDGFCRLSREELQRFMQKMDMAMDLDDLLFCQEYFQKEHRDPTVTELRVIDTYWSDHCRHTTFLTTIDRVSCEDPLLQKAYDRYLAVRKELGREKPVHLMDLATIAAKYLRKSGKLPLLDESDEINACTIKIKVETNKGSEDWLLLFKNETHNHPTEIEPFGGAATCIGGAIRDPLSGRAYVYAAMRVTGAANPLAPIQDTLPGKLPQRTIATQAAAGYSSYGNQIGLATGLVDEIYHPGYLAKRMEVGAVLGAAPAENVIRQVPQKGDVVILLGGKTGRDGCGGATGSSQSHTQASLEHCGAQVQKGNPPEERKLQRFFRKKEAARLIKRCNDFGAGGVSVAIGELAEGVEIELNAVPKKYEGLSGTELAISESQERMAVVVSGKDAKRFCEMALKENIEAVKVAEVTDKARLCMHWNGKTIVDISRAFLDTNGAPKHTCVQMKAEPVSFEKEITSFRDGMLAMAGNLNSCSKQGLSEQFDSTIGAATVLMPFGGKYQETPIQAMVHTLPVLDKNTDTCSMMAYGYRCDITEKSPYHGGYLAVVEAVSKLVAAGASFSDIYLTFQEYFEKPKRDPKRWGKPMAALLGAFMAQMDLEIAAIGGKDSMSGTFEGIDVPPTLICFAVTTELVRNILSPELKREGSLLYLLKPEYDSDHLPIPSSLKNLYHMVHEKIEKGEILSAYTLPVGGAGEALMKMALGNRIGVLLDDHFSLQDLFASSVGSFVVELVADAELPFGTLIGETTAAPAIRYRGETVTLQELAEAYRKTLTPVYPMKADATKDPVPAISYTQKGGARSSLSFAKPRVLIPVFPGTNCEYDSQRAFERVGACAEGFVVNNQTPQKIAESAEAFASSLSQAQILFIPGGFSGGDEPDGSGKFITAFLRHNRIAEEIMKLMQERDGLICGICNGFQALIKLGLVPYGKIMMPSRHAPTLTYNTIGHHQSRLVRTRISSTLSPWFSKVSVGDIFTVPISHGEGRFIAELSEMKRLIENGQIATQYVDLEGNPTMEMPFNPNGSVCAVEGITSQDGRILGKMGHSERVGKELYKNVPGNGDSKIFESAVFYYR